ncbi:MAG: NUDIX domain-containing protein [Candidatus Kerfeldbacteria bacterium]|nr:NUDIX domain-containing protein [Candidatus Kerfeldbacteria bacterium]
MTAPNIQKPSYPKAGVGVMVMKVGKVLLGKRKGAHGEGEYAFPGGHLEFGESVVACAKRETREETGIEITNVQFLFFMNLTRYPGKHYAHIGLIADWQSGEPRVLEPDKSEQWGWYLLDKLPTPLFEACKISIESYRTGKNFFDSE